MRTDRRYYERMEDEFRDQMENLERSLLELEQASRKALGIVHTVEHHGIPFNVSRRFVIADLSPLAFFHLVEHIEDNDPGAAISRLYIRLTPLLSCRHAWTPLRRAEDEVKRTIVSGTDPARKSAIIYICQHCTAYAQGGSLPVVGRTLASSGE